MKKLTILLLLLPMFSLAQIVNDYTSYNKVDYKELINMLKPDINVEGVTIYISDLSLTNKHIGNTALVERLNDSVFNIVMERVPKYIKVRVIIHELVHIRQMLDNRLKTGSNYAYFDGILYTEFPDRNILPYEIEAQNQTEKLYYKYRKEIKKL